MNFFVLHKMRSSDDHTSSYLLTPSFQNLKLASFSRISIPKHVLSVGILPVSIVPWLYLAKRLNRSVAESFRHPIINELAF